METMTKEDMERFRCRGHCFSMFIVGKALIIVRVDKQGALGMKLMSVSNPIEWILVRKASPAAKNFS